LAGIVLNHDDSNGVAALAQTTLPGFRGAPATRRRRRRPALGPQHLPVNHRRGDSSGGGCIKLLSGTSPAGSASPIFRYARKRRGFYLW
jgi:hypothetical protein